MLNWFQTANRAYITTASSSFSKRSRWCRVLRLGQTRIKIDRRSREQITPEESRELHWQQADVLLVVGYTWTSCRSLVAKIATCNAPRKTRRPITASDVDIYGHVDVQDSGVRGVGYIDVGWVLKSDNWMWVGWGIFEIFIGRRISKVDRRLGFYG